MIIYLLFAQRIEDYEGEHAPEVLESVDEYVLGGTSLDAVEKEVIEGWKREYGGELSETFVAWQWIEIRLGQVEKAIRDILLKPPALEGHAVLPTPKMSNHPSYNGITVQEGRVPGKIVDDEILD